MLYYLGIYDVEISDEHPRYTQLLSFQRKSNFDALLNTLKPRIPKNDEQIDRKLESKESQKHNVTTLEN